MRELIRQFIKTCADVLPIHEPIYEFGSLQVPGQEGFADLRPIFHNKKYVGADIQEGPGVDVILNLHSIDLPSESVGSVLVLDTLEHVAFPQQAIKEIYRILNKNGILIITSGMKMPIHNYPYDYWRFTPDGFKILLESFASSFVDFAGEDDFPHTVVGVGFKSPISENILNEFIKKCKAWKEYWSNSSVIGWRQYWDNPSIGMWKKIVRMSTPPILLPVLLKIYKRIKRT